MYEKEEWLYRLMMGKTLVFPTELKKRKTTLTYAADVAVAISELIENESAYGEIFHITTTESLSWEDAFEKYTSILSETTGKQFHIKYVDDIEMFYNIWNPYQIKYDCNIDRRFDNSKINRATNNSVVTKDVPKGAIVGGNPAKVIGWTEELAKRRIAENRKNYTIFNEVEEVEKYYWEILPHNNN